MKIRIYMSAAFAVIALAAPAHVPAQNDKYGLPTIPHKTEPGALPDLMIASAKFRYTTAEVVIRNAGKAPAKATRVDLNVYATTDPGSKVTVVFNLMTPVIGAGKEYRLEYSSANFNGHARRVVIDPTNVLNESNKRNNQLFSNESPLPDEGSFPEGVAFDLTFTKVKFISPATVNFCVKNVGSGPSGEFKVRTTIFNGAKKSSGQYKSATEPFNSLNANQQQCFKFSFATYGIEEVFVNRGRLIEILSNDANGGDNSYFEPAEQAPWKPDTPQ
jgi:CARDB